MLSSIAAGIEPLISKGSDVLDNLDNALTNLNLTLSEENRESLRNIMENLDRTIAEIEQIAGTVEGRKNDIDSFIANLNAVSSGLDAIMERADSTMTDIRSVSAGLAEADIASLVEKLDSLLVKVRGTEGTVGRLINEDSVYNSVDSLVSDLDRLVRKIEENPKKYIRISVF